MKFMMMKLDCGNYVGLMTPIYIVPRQSKVDANVNSTKPKTEDIRTGSSSSRAKVETGLMSFRNDAQNEARMGFISDAWSEFREPSMWGVLALGKRWGRIEMDRSSEITENKVYFVMDQYLPSISE
jgi:hypothetical protein